jgi:hypothetical protein
MTLDQLGMISAHADSLEDIAREFDAAGIGQHPHRGHAAVLRAMASSIRCDVCAGRVPQHL